jgi:glycerophosphoryl diester phosphodiesterase
VSASRPYVLAHRGGAREAPENTLAAFTHALAAGADGVELDVRLSADGKPLVFHDDHLGRFHHGATPVDEMAAAVLVAADLGRRRPRFRGTRIPTLAETLALLAPARLLNLELKPSSDPGRLVAAVLAELETASAPERLLLTSFDPRVVDALRRTAPALARGYVLDRVPEDDAWRSEPAVSLSLAVARTGLAQDAARTGQRVLVWTENDPRRLEPWRQRGVEAVITDRPARFAAFRAARSRDCGRAGAPDSEPFGAAGEDEMARPGFEPLVAQEMEDLGHQEARDPAADQERLRMRRVPPHAG